MDLQSDHIVTVRGKTYYSPVAAVISKLSHPISSAFAGAVCSVFVQWDKGNPIPIAMICSILDEEGT